MAWTVTDNSTAIRVWEGVVARVRAAVSTAPVRQLATHAFDVQQRAAEHVADVARRSRLHVAAARARTAVRTSYSYRWLTADPDPDAIIINLRETYTLGWLIILIGWVAQRLGPPLQAAVHLSRVADLRTAVRAGPLRALGVVVLVATVVNLGLDLATGTLGWLGLAIHALLVLLGVAGLRSTASWREIRESTLGRWLASVLEPPEPPDGTDGASVRSSKRSAHEDERSSDGTSDRP
jgi:hypothetical protein